VVLQGQVGGAGGDIEELYRANSVSFPSISAFAISSKSTHIVPDHTEHLAAPSFDRRKTMIYAVTEELTLTDTPFAELLHDIPLAKETLTPVTGTSVVLGRRVENLAKGRKLVLSGKRIRARVATASAALLLKSDDATKSEWLAPRSSLIVLQPPVVQPDGTILWRLRHDSGLEGTLSTTKTQLHFARAAKDDPIVSERLIVTLCEGSPTELTFDGEGITNIYDRASVAITANVAEATHGETVEEIGGSGDATQQFQKFALRQPPLTYLRALNPRGMASTLEVRIDDVLWHQEQTLYKKKPDQRVYTERLDHESKTIVRFGDGRGGARLPSGQQNVRFKYRKGSGLEGLVRAGQLSQLITRPLGVKDAINAFASEGADDPEQLGDARENAPLTVLTLERVVSLQDYEDFSRAFPGIAKALATWTWDGKNRGVFLTVAAPKGMPVATSPGSTGADLLASLRKFGDPFVPIRIESYRAAWFQIGGSVLVHPDYEKEKVLSSARALLKEKFGFAARRFGQPVVLSEILGALHGVPGVVAGDLDHLQRTDSSVPEDPAPRLLAEFPGGGVDGSAKAAELLLLSEQSLELLKAAP
jgi:hypothetical protein